MPHPSKIDPSILSTLSLSAKDITFHPHGSSGFTSSYRLTTPQTSIFIKTSSTPDASIMFEGEHNSLNAIHSVCLTLAPKSFAWGELSDSNGYFLATEFLDMSSGGHASGGGGSGQTLAQKLATLHSTPPPTEYREKGFGFPVPTCCGSTIQNNTWKSSWATFFAENRLLHILGQAEANHGANKQLRSLVEETARNVVPRLLGEDRLGGGDVKPVLCHGDLWSGNKTHARFIGRGDDAPTEAVIFDPSACYAHHEYDHGIMNMFGGFNGAFWKEYWQHMPGGRKCEPVDEYEDRVKLYECYHQLNHYVMFGGGYRGAAMGIMKGLIERYSGDGKGKG